jgi:cellulose synthase/poly-beta-1,6-N-acetylglucosamine synthase-like glycosyltransferase
MSIAEIIILINIFLLLYVYFIYPVFIAIAAKLFSKPLNSSLDYEPDITVIIAAYNEGRYIEDCVRSIYGSDYPYSKIRVKVGSDGSNDNTVEKLNELKGEYPSLDYYEFNRIGKNNVINELMKYVDTEIIYFLDADCRLEKNALRSVISKFYDRSIGAVLVASNIISDQRIEDIGKTGERIYQKYEKMIIINESKLHSNISTIGSYGIRKEIWEKYPDDRVCDDFYNILQVVLKGKRAILDEEVIVYEVRPKSLKDEFERRTRIIACNLSTIFYLKKLLKPKFGWVALSLWSHKLLRSFSPLNLLFVLLCTFFINTDSILLLPLIIIQGILYLGTAVGIIFEKFNIHILPIKILLFFVSMNLGLIVGTFRFLKRQRNSLWERIDTKNLS